MIFFKILKYFLKFVKYLIYFKNVFPAKSVP